jgi:hypothetical protein
MPAPTKLELATEAQKTYGLMESHRPVAAVSSVASTFTGLASSLTSTLTAGYVTTPTVTYSVKTPKFDPIVKAADETQRLHALKALREDKEAIASNRVSSLKTILDILDHAYKASDGLYAENTDDAVKARFTPAEAAEEAIEALTPIYQQLFLNAPNNAKFLLMISQSINASLKMEKQQALAAAAIEKEAAIEAARAEEKLTKQKVLAETRANALLAKKLAVHHANKKAEAQHFHAIATIEDLDTRHSAERLNNHAKAEQESERLYNLNLQAEEAAQIEKAELQVTIDALQSRLASQQSALRKLTDCADSAHEEAEMAVDFLFIEKIKNEQLHDQLDNAQENIQNRMQTSSAHKKEMVHLNHALIQTFNENQRFHQDIEILGDKIRRIEGALGLRTEELRYTKESRDQFAAQVQQLAQQKKMLEQTLSDKREVTNELVVQVNQLQHVNTNLREQLAITELDIQHEQQQSSVMATMNTSLSTQTDLLQEKLALQQELLELAKAQLHEKEDELKHRNFAQELAAEQAVSQSAKSELGKAEVYIQQQSCELHSLKGTMHHESEQNKSLRKEVTKLTKQLDDLRLSNSAKNANSYFQKKQQQQQHQQSHNHHQPKFSK